jgi:hypothetical protein
MMPIEETTYPWIWLRSRGANVSGVATARFKHSGALLRGLAAVHPAQRGDLLFSVPAKLIIDSSAIAEDGSTLLARAQKKASADFLLASLLLEAGAGTSSDHGVLATHIAASLPMRKSEHPIWWFAFSATYPRTLQYFNTTRLLRDVASVLTARVISLRAASLTFARDYVAHSSRQVRDAACDPVLMIRAVLHVGTTAFFPPRGFSVQDDDDGDNEMYGRKVLLPVVDLINHADEPGGANVDWSVQRTPAGMQLMVTAIHPIAAGDELLTEDYGAADVDLETFFSAHGFVPYHFRRTQSRLVRVLAKAQSIAAQEAAAESELSGSGQSIEGWPKLPSHCGASRPRKKKGIQQRKRAGHVKAHTPRRTKDEVR